MRLAEIYGRQAETDLERMEKLYKDKLVSSEEYEKTLLAAKQAREELQAAKDNLEIVKEGITKSSASFSSTLIRSTIDGLILDVPIKVGNSVIMSNTFNDGTTIATVADMSDLIFRGNVDETEVGRIHEGTPVKITLGALQNMKFDAVLEYISSVCSLAFPGRMITPFPYEAAAELVIFVHQLHVIMDIPGAVAHCMNKFTLNKGLSHSAVFAVFLYPLGIRIHPAHHIQHGNIVVITCGIPEACLKVQQTGRIISLYPSSGDLKVAAVAALIAQGPENNRALVFVPDHISLLTVEDRLRPGIILCDVAHAVVTIICIQSYYAMAFQICFRDHVKSVFTA